ncbi:hypothetical protein AZF37_03980 [endosymbiont 'TC1' of Trimyema compressum]|uniref:hypothetical protein n=1 Tax=endosymbiont 'TC1' of Trimyema compressum TaxID=243899 RepID=UPI0007F137E2|nr:hypothetical protein [endosymbiont 'TC1' of Trimyema compressum]AMP20441.1 hypothetical protein AZF37_03980 [endosymbiont 'TC1' of Trimyema compressum]
MSEKWIGRSALENIKPYSPGKSVSSVEKELGLSEIYKMASNENAIGPSKKLLQQLMKSFYQCIFTQMVIANF